MIFIMLCHFRHFADAAAIDMPRAMPMITRAQSAMLMMLFMMLCHVDADADADVGAALIICASACCCDAITR